MSSSAVYNAFATYLRDQFNGVYAVLDFDAIEPTLQQGTDPFLALEEITADETLAGFGDQAALCVRESGSILVHAFTPAPESSNSARTIIDSVRDALRFAAFSGLRIVAVLPPDMETLNEGLWSVAGTAVLYEYDAHYSRGGP